MAFPTAHRKHCALLAAAMVAATAGCSSSHASATTTRTTASASATADPRTPVSTIGSRSSSQTFGRPTVQRTSSGTTAALPDGRNRVQYFTVPTPQGDVWNLQMVLPKGYFDAANAHRAYPVIVFAHGVPGSNQAWFRRMSVEKLLDPLVAEHKVQPFIAVLPEVTAAGDSECIVGSRGNTETEDWLTRSVPAFVRSHVRAIAQRDAWAVAGYSAGGWCANALPILHPDVYAAGISLGGYFNVWWGNLRPTWAADSAQARRLDLATTMRLTHPRVALFVQTATDDPESWPSTRAFLRRVEAPTLVSTLVYPSGGHSFALWTAGLQRGVAWLGRTVPGFRP